MICILYANFLQIKIKNLTLFKEAGVYFGCYYGVVVLELRFY